MNGAALTETLATIGDQRADELDDGPRFPRGDSAVLILLVVDPDGAGVVLTRRAAALATDAGFVAFPGGKLDPGESAEGAARRECEEETGIAASTVQLRGRLDASWNGAGFRILPVVATVDATISAVTRALRPHDAEVAEAAVLPLAQLIDPARHRVSPISVAGFDFADDVIDVADGWRLVGPSAGIAVDLADRIRRGGPDPERRARRRAELAHFAHHRWEQT